MPVAISLACSSDCVTYLFHGKYCVVCISPVGRTPPQYPADYPAGSPSFDHNEAQYLLGGCSANAEAASLEATGDSSERKTEATEKGKEITLQFGDTKIMAVLDQSESSKAFLELLSLTLDMRRYADREYYAAID